MVTVARVVMAAALYGPGTPYGHPTDGLASTAARVDLPAVKAFDDLQGSPSQPRKVIPGQGFYKPT